MTKKQAANLIRNLTADIGKREHKDLWHYLEPLYMIREMLDTEDEIAWKPLTKPYEPKEINNGRQMETF